MPSEVVGENLSLIRNILNILCLLSNNLKIYPEGNPVIRVTASRLMLQIEKYLSMEHHLTLTVARHGFLCEDLFIDRSSEAFAKFANFIFMHGVAALSLRRGVSEYEVVTLLRLIGRKPAETWDEGGMRACLAGRNIEHIDVVEISEDNFLFLDEEGESVNSGGLADKSDLWDRFALSILHRQQGRDEIASGSLAPEEIARETSAYYAGQGEEERQTFIKELADFMVSLQHENIRIYRAQAMEKLCSYINHLSADLKRLFLQKVFNYNLKGDFAEGLFSRLSDDLIISALENAAKGESYTPPVVLNLLGKLARSRELLPADSPLLPGVQDEEVQEKTRELFRSDEFEKYVPVNYRDALMKILSSEEVDGGLKGELSRLKKTLQEEALEEHTGQIIMQILGHHAEERHLGGVFDNLEKILELYADAGNYQAISDIRGLCAEQGGSAETSLTEILEAPAFIKRTLDGALRFGIEKHEALGRLIQEIGFPFVEPILDRLATEKNRSVRYFYIKCLKGLGPAVAEHVSHRLGNHPWYYLRNLLSLLRELGERSQAGMVRPYFRHPHPKVRLEAIKTGLSLRDPQSLRILLELLDSKVPAEVDVAVNLARMARDPKVVAKLTSLLEANALFDYHLPLKKGIVMALIEIDQRQALPVLKRFLAGGNLLHPILHAQLKRDVVKALENFEPALVKELLQSQAASKDEEIAHIATELLARMKRGKS